MNPIKDRKNDTSNSDQETISRVFGAENRARLLRGYLDGIDSINPKNAWQHVYRLLLWIDRTTALAHCYESDKHSQAAHGMGDH